MPTEIKERHDYYLKGQWPAKKAYVVKINNGHDVLITVDGVASFASKGDLYMTRLEADEATLVSKRIQLENARELVSSLEEEISDLETKKGMA